ncbi:MULTISPECIES: cobyrinate a,c-diamide synthase [unclassified Leptolyngbya]|uniref:cobyrinate a,c-diamide synthase n=1 Tax=unclassified Leptolyngbya TaxID=2650499 RepID=UPI001682301F|nr:MULTISPECIES: cobyrinate a,c-diamide synthase [unclassified Leptolyngbya]MBD1913315.1 cobyrinate a,c-diamide synthase [Leptolyngbya sp. FACHB-8]MBD2155338.1 cobyrinate a,c-diamide synthase [Leptolyngbya sp. FACHB-16]
MALIIAGERSGVGKTTITLAMLAYLRQKGVNVQSFKVGPDYIDPMFHRWITGRPCYNLDPVLASESYVQGSFAQHSTTAEATLVEGVMGLFDGASGTDDVASTAHIARLLHVPVLLVLDCARLSRSVAAIAHGYRSFDSRIQIAGVILNRVGSDRHLTLLKEALEGLQLPILGVLHRHNQITIPDRHLGLVPTGELEQMGELCENLAAIAHESFDWEQLLPLLSNTSGRSRESSPQTPKAAVGSVAIAIARDAAFNFYYPDNLECLASLGAELHFWSPLQDMELPPHISGLYFGGGFPEVFAEALAENRTAQQSVKSAIAHGMPVYGECGGLMYLSQAITDFEGKRWPMVGALPTETRMGTRLTLGYRRAIAQQDSPLVQAETEVWGHEFHRSSLTGLPEAPLYQMQRFDGKALGGEGWRSPTLHASYLHMHWGDRLELPERFLQHCRHFAAQK